MSASLTDLPATPPEVKRYQRLKLLALTINTALTFIALAVLALVVGPALRAWLAPMGDDNRWLSLLISAGVVAMTMETLTLPLAFWSGFVLEHRFGLSNQTFKAWLWQRVKGYLVGGVVGGLLLAGLYAILWWSGAWWWLWATLGWLGV